MLNSANFHKNHRFSWKFTIFMKFHENGRNSWFSRKMRFGAKWPPEPPIFLRDFMVSGEGRGFRPENANFLKIRKIAFFWKFRKFHDFGEICGIFTNSAFFLRRPRALPGPPFPYVVNTRFTHGRRPGKFPNVERREGEGVFSSSFPSSDSSLFYLLERALIQTSVCMVLKSIVKQHLS